MHLDCWNISGGPFHFGLHGMGEEVVSLTLSSDSLFAALVAALAARSSPVEVESLLQPFMDGDPPFLLSSTFIRAGQVNFLPVPLLKHSAVEIAGSTTALDRKALKRVRWASPHVYQLLVAGKPMPALKLTAGGTALAMPDENLLPEPWWSEDTRTRVAVDREQNKSQIFKTGSLSFAEDCGLWFAIQWRQPGSPWAALLPALLQQLADSGLGGTRSSGFGACAIINAPGLDLPDPLPGGLWTNLSRFAPRQQDMPAVLHPQARYQLVSTNGWVDSPFLTGQRRRSSTFVAEGALLGPLPDVKVPGRLLDVRPSYLSDPDPLGHPVYRNGQTICVGVAGGAA